MNQVVKLRLWRLGSKGRPVYRIVAAHDSVPLSGKYIESIGTYDPIQQPGIVRVDVDRARYWLSVGAQPTETVKAILVKTEVLDVNGQIILVEGSHADPVVGVMKELIRKTNPYLAKSPELLFEFASFLARSLRSWKQEYEKAGETTSGWSDDELEYLSQLASRVVDEMTAGYSRPRRETEMLERQFGRNRTYAAAAD